MAEFLISSASAVEAGGCTWSGFGPSVVLRENTSKMGYDRFNNIYAGSISLPLLDVFDFQSVAGDVHDLKRAQSVIVSRSTAEQLGVGVGDMVWCDTDQPSAENAREVVAIFEDFPANSLMAKCHMAMDLGDQAEALEMAGREKDLAKIADNTTDLLEECDALGETLAFLSEPQ